MYAGSVAVAVPDAEGRSMDPMKLRVRTLAGAGRGEGGRVEDDTESVRERSSLLTVARPTSVSGARGSLERSPRDLNDLKAEERLRRPDVRVGRREGAGGRAGCFMAEYVIEYWTRS